MNIVSSKTESPCTKIINIVVVVSQGTAPATDAQQLQHHTAAAGWKTHQGHQMAVGLV